MYWTECRVVACEPGRRFAFAVRSRPFGLPIGPRTTVRLIWSYVLTETDGGTDVTESFELAETLPMRLHWALLGWARGSRNSRDMRRTLEAIKTAVEN